jgi:hypothetical protein
MPTIWKSCGSLCDCLFHKDDSPIVEIVDVLLSCGGSHHHSSAKTSASRTGDHIPVDNKLNEDLNFGPSDRGICVPKISIQNLAGDHAGQRDSKSHFIVHKRPNSIYAHTGNCVTFSTSNHNRDTFKLGVSPKIIESNAECVSPHNPNCIGFGDVSIRV